MCTRHPAGRAHSRRPPELPGARAVCRRRPADHRRAVRRPATALKHPLATPYTPVDPLTAPAAYSPCCPLQPFHLALRDVTPPTPSHPPTPFQVRRQVRIQERAVTAARDPQLRAGRPAALISYVLRPPYLSPLTPHRSPPAVHPSPLTPHRSQDDMMFGPLTFQDGVSGTTLGKVDTPSSLPALPPSITPPPFPAQPPSLSPSLSSSLPFSLPAVSLSPSFPPSPSTFPVYSPLPTHPIHLPRYPT